VHRTFVQWAQTRSLPADTRSALAYRRSRSSAQVGELVAHASGQVAGVSGAVASGRAGREIIGVLGARELQALESVVRRFLLGSM